jgi:hypothetical protein
MSWTRSAQQPEPSRGGERERRRQVGRERGSEGEREREREREFGQATRDSAPIFTPRTGRGDAGRELQEPDRARPSPPSLSTGELSGGSRPGRRECDATSIFGGLLDLPIPRGRWRACAEARALNRRAFLKLPPSRRDHRLPSRRLCSLDFPLFDLLLPPRPSPRTLSCPPNHFLAIFALVACLVASRLFLRGLLLFSLVTHRSYLFNPCDASLASLRLSSIF